MAVWTLTTGIRSRVQLQAPTAEALQWTGLGKTGIGQLILTIHISEWSMIVCID